MLKNNAIIYATRTGIVAEIQTRYLEKIEKGMFDEIPLNLLKELIKIQAIVPSTENELLSILHENKSYNDSNTGIGFVVQPTANCQLGCHYCGQVHSKKVMTTDVSDLMIERIENKIKNSKKGQITYMDITWYGGEPLTGLSSIEYTSPLLQQIAKNYDIKYFSRIITNGLTLKEALFKRLVVDHKIKAFQITLDGTKDFHDKRRMLKNGNPSFDIIFNNIRSIASSDFYKESKTIINIRCNVSSDNQNDIFKLMALFKENNIHNKVNFNVARVEDWADNDAGKVENGAMSKEDFSQFEIDVMLKKTAEGFLICKEDLIPSRTYNVCMATTIDAEVFDGFGNVSTCWEIPYTPFYEGSSFVEGNIKANPNIDTSNTAMRKWYDEIPDNNAWCKNCKFLPVCGGGCPKDWYLGNPACPPFKFNIDERLLMRKFNVVQ